MHSLLNLANHKRGLPGRSVANRKINTTIMIGVLHTTRVPLSTGVLFRLSPFSIVEVHSKQILLSYRSGREWSLYFFHDRI
jgi:hypothetical protein